LFAVAGVTGEAWGCVETPKAPRTPTVDAEATTAEITATARS
jgi:hypothetical protein